MYVRFIRFCMPAPSKRKTYGKQDKSSAGSTQRPQELRTTSPMNAERLRKLYAAMLKCRFSQDEIRKSLPDHPLCAGLEAVIAGAGIHLKPQDLVAPSGQGDFVQLVQGKALQEILDCRKQEISKLQDGRRSTAELNVAAGMALACQHLKKPLITLCVVQAEGGPDFWRDAVSFCAGRKLSIVFLIAQHSSPEQSNIDLRNEAQKFLPAITVDGNDVVAVYRVAEESTRRAREGLGPSLIECRLETGGDPLAFMESYLRQRDLWSDAWKEELERDLRRKKPVKTRKSK